MKKILVIEDETPVRQNLVELLSAEGYFPIEARDGEEGVHLTWDVLPDLILCDINMPRMDGYTVLSKISRDPATAAIPFIFLTARTEREDLRRGMALGADDYIMKPFTIDDVLGSIQKRFEKRGVIEKQAEKKLAELSKNVSLSLPGELLTPLSLILSCSELLANYQEIDQIDQSQVRSMGQEIQRSGAVLLRSIQNYTLYCDLEQIQNSEKRLAMLRGSQVFSAKQSIEEIAIQKARQEGRQGDLNVQVQDAVLLISEMYLQKMIEELLDNAFKFSRSGSPVTIIGEMQPGQPVYRLRVTDQGRGMGAEQVAALTGRLQTGLRSPDRPIQGIGLTLVKRLTELHQGRFSIQSQLGQGTTVQVILLPAH